MSNYDPLDVQGQESAKAEKARRNRIAETDDDADLQWLMGSKRGRRIVWRQLERAGVFKLSFNTNAMTMAFAEGNRNEGLRVLAQIHSRCPELYPVMVKEHVNARRNPDDGSGHNDH